MRVAVVGGGFGARVVAPVFADTPGCEVVDTVSARDEAAVRALVTRADVDLVSVHSPPFLHAPHVRLALAEGKAVLCDKPFALDADEAADLEAEARAAAVVALCNFEFRYDPARALLRELVAEGELGRIEHVQMTRISSGTRVPLRQWGWLFDRELGGGWIGAWGSHAVDTLRFVLASEVTDVQALLRTDIRERPDADGARHECTAEDGFSASMAMANGVTVAIDSGFAAVANVAPRFTLFGSEAVAEVVGESRISIRRADGSRESIDLSEASEADGHLAPMRRFAEVVRDSVTSGEIPASAPTFSDGRACDAVLDQLRAAPFAPDPSDPE
ncbi:MAG TPA: Gfo/Idh/MocA family oxidoreductase [Acidimicrobiia bacterium]|jgi:predicted dehydrogenase|nr:Gfo/Idh/MocA family oxidoreductase [Acidimicrobiia bacterium]